MRRLPREETEHSAALWLGYYFWHREAEKWRGRTDDRSKPTEQRAEALKRMETAWHWMRLCKEAKRWWRGDAETDTLEPCCSTEISCQANTKVAENDATELGSSRFELTS